MTTVLLAFAGGLLTILSPCILPVVPLVFAQVERSGRQRALMLGGLAVMFAVVAAGTSVSIRWIAAANEVGRWLALGFLALVALSLLSERAAEWMARPFVRFGARLDSRARSEGAVAGPLLTGVAIGLLWAPCAGPILALVIVGGATRGSWTATAGLLVAFALGATSALAVVHTAGRRVLAQLHRSAHMSRWIRPALGAAAMVAVFAIALGADRALLAKGTFVQTAAAEELLISRLAPRDAPRVDKGQSLADFAAEHSLALQAEGPIQSFAGATEWINSTPLTAEALRGKVVLVDFWTFGCINCLNALPHVKQLYAKYKEQGLVVIGVHTPELPRERIASNVRAAVRDLGISYPVVIDNEYAIWKRWENQFWPAAYYVDAKGQIRFHHFGEGRYDEQELVVKQLLAEARAGRQ